MAAVALVVVDLERGFLGLRAALGDPLAGQSVLEHTVQRAGSLREVREVVLVHPSGQDPLSLIDPEQIDVPVTGFAYRWDDALRHQQAHLAAARKWSLTAWRGGLGSATVYDELLPAGPLAAAMAARRATGAIIVRGEWCLFDTGLAAEQLRVHLEAPEAMKLTFTQAPPGLSALATSGEVLAQLAKNQAGFGQIFGYNPHQPAIDPIGREANIAIDACVRDCAQRFIYDTPRSKALLEALAKRLGEALADADAKTITDAYRAIDAQRDGQGRLPQQITIELTPQRHLDGPLCPQRYVALEREMLELDTARRIFEQLADEGAGGDAAVMLGGLGDALVHPQWDQIVLAARAAGVLGVGIETDLLCDRQVIGRLMELPIDVVAVRLNADTASTYEKVHGADRFNKAADNLLALIEARRRRGEQGDGPGGLPWIVPKLIKTAETLTDMESFFERWARTFGCHPVIEPALTGAGKMPDMNLIPMAGPKRGACRQLGRRMTVLSDGRVAQCDQDWLGEAAVGEVHDASLVSLHQAVAQRCAAHAGGDYSSLALCGSCTQWHRP